MSEKLFDFGVDIPTKITKYTKRFTDLEGFLDEDYDGEHHMLWDNQEECWICLSDVLCLMEKEYVNIKEENERLRNQLERQTILLKIRTKHIDDREKSFHELLNYLESFCYKSNIDGNYAKQDIINILNNWEVKEK